jgi:hypothetical protein
MVDSDTLDIRNVPQKCGASSCHIPNAAWSFVYVFFTNGIPFDAPNRSEPCPLR